MTLSQKMQLLKKLETLVVLQENCLDEGNWECYDKVEVEIKKLEKEITCSAD
ncbi:MAG TPA: hypothetical protein P5232_01820 [Candidatus Moranbacteria bacterium]|nr:hypothetical protein [Candidatus Moranbacteria bacterium]